MSEDTPTTVAEPMAAALCMDALVKALAVIEKDRESPQGYRFRGIEDVLGAIHPIMAKHSCWLQGRVIDLRELEHSTAQSGAIWHRVAVLVDYSLRGFDGSFEPWGTYPGEGSDSQDKAVACAMSNALKTACFQTFAVPVEDAAHDAEAVAFQAGAPGGTYLATGKAAKVAPLPPLPPKANGGSKSKAISDKQAGLLLFRAIKASEASGSDTSEVFAWAFAALGIEEAPPERVNKAWLVGAIGWDQMDAILAKLDEAKAMHEAPANTPAEEEIPF